MFSKITAATKAIPATLALVLALSACGSKKASTSTDTTTSTTTSNGASSTSGTGSIGVVLYNPAPGNVNAAPTQVMITFSEATLDQSGDSGSVTNLGNYALNCANTSYAASAATYDNAGTVTVTFPSISLASGTQCKLLVSSQIQDLAGNWVSSNQSAIYIIGSGSGSTYLSISAFNPASETVAVLPTMVDIYFNEQNLDVTGGAYSALNTSNYTYNCAGNIYAPTSAAVIGNGTVALGLPSVTLVGGETCVLNVSPNVRDAAGHSLSGVTQVVYTQSVAPQVWNENTVVTYTTAYGNTYTGTGFHAAAATGLVMTGIQTRTGSYIDQIGGVWTNGFASSNQILGPNYGGSGGTSNAPLTCPSNMRLIGLYGTYDTQIDSIGIICETQDLTQKLKIGTYGSTGSISFMLTCPSGQFATDFAGVAGGYVQQVQLGCR